MYTHILIAIDGSELADKGLVQGLALAASLKSQVTVVTVSEPMSSGYDDIYGWSGAQGVATDYKQAMQERADKILKAAEAKAAEAGVAAAGLHLAGRYAADGIIETARSKGCDLIVMASHGRRGLGRLLIGSQTTEVLTHTEVPVLVIR